MMDTIQTGSIMSIFYDGYYDANQFKMQCKQIDREHNETKKEFVRKWILSRGAGDVNLMIKNALIAWDAIEEIGKPE